jgi:hypothetical protein
MLKAAKQLLVAGFMGGLLLSAACTSPTEPVDQNVKPDAPRFKGIIPTHSKPLDQGIIPGGKKP